MFAMLTNFTKTLRIALVEGIQNITNNESIYVYAMFFEFASHV